VGTAAPSAFVREYGAVLGALNFTWYFNEAHFHLDGYINSPGFNKMVPYLTPAVPYFAVFMIVFKGRVVPDW
jgi:hypothetical protein